MNERRSITRMRKKSIMESALLSLSLSLSLEPGTCVHCDHVIYLDSMIRLRFDVVRRSVIAGQFPSFF